MIINLWNQSVANRLLLVDLVVASCGVLIILFGYPGVGISVYGVAILHMGILYPKYRMACLSHHPRSSKEDFATMWYINHIAIGVLVIGMTGCMWYRLISPVVLGAMFTIVLSVFAHAGQAYMCNKP